ncbi:unnamed protein product [Leptidea sinapis]|uniref:Protein kinase domain-containing protein n=1 Tax=Leptidea sinapis TaxID=189913 RepID=A0A5E4QLF6_9NEOP|nr:unnamed protein product [Leptidea sinapis]
MSFFNNLKKVLHLGSGNDAKKKKVFSNIRDNSDPAEYWDMIGELGDGAFGKVYKAQHKVTGQLAAAKMCMLDHEDDLSDFTVEIDILSECRHPNVVELHEAYFIDNKLWMLLEYCDGGALDSVMSELEKGLSESQIAYVCREMCRGLEFLHSRRVDIWSLGITLIEFAQMEPPNHEMTPMRHEFVCGELDSKPLRELLLEYRAEVVEEELLDDDAEEHRSSQMQMEMEDDSTSVRSADTPDIKSERQRRRKVLPPPPPPPKKEKGPAPPPPAAPAPAPHSPAARAPRKHPAPRPPPTSGPHAAGKLIVDQVCHEAEKMVEESHKTNKSIDINENDTKPKYDTKQDKVTDDTEAKSDEHVKTNNVNSLADIDKIIDVRPNSLSNNAEVDIKANNVDGISDVDKDVDPKLINANRESVIDRNDVVVTKTIQNGRSTDKTDSPKRNSIIDRNIDVNRDTMIKENHINDNTKVDKLKDSKRASIELNHVDTKSKVEMNNVHDKVNKTRRESVDDVSRKESIDKIPNDTSKGNRYDKVLEDSRNLSNKVLIDSKVETEKVPEEVSKIDRKDKDLAEDSRTEKKERARSTDEIGKSENKRVSAEVSRIESRSRSVDDKDRVSELRVRREYSRTGSIEEGNISSVEVTNVAKRAAADVWTAARVKDNQSIEENGEHEGEVVLRRKPQENPHRIQRSKEDIHLANLKKKTRKRTRKFEIDGVIVTTTTSKVIWGDEESGRTWDDHALRKQELREIKMLQKQEQKQFQNLNSKEQQLREQQDKRFEAELSSLTRAHEADLDTLARAQRAAAERAEQQLEAELRAHAKRLRADHERDLRHFRDTLKQELRLKNTRKEEELAKCQALEKRSLPKRIRAEQKAREMICKQALLRELEQYQNEKRKALMNHESNKMKTIEERYAAELKEFRATLSDRRQKRIESFAKDLDDHEKKFGIPIPDRSVFLDVPWPQNVLQHVLSSYHQRNSFIGSLSRSRTSLSLALSPTPDMERRLSSPSRQTKSAASSANNTTRRGKLAKAQKFGSTSNLKLVSEKISGFSVFNNEDLKRQPIMAYDDIPIERQVTKIEEEPRKLERSKLVKKINRQSLSEQLFRQVNTDGMKRSISQQSLKQDVSMEAVVIDMPSLEGGHDMAYKNDDASSVGSDDETKYLSRWGPALDDEFNAQLEEQERLSANARLPPPPSTMPQHSSTLHSSRTSLTSSHYE